MKLSANIKNRLVRKYGDWAVITGASSGIGRELTYRVCEAGLNAVIVARNENSLRDIKNDIENKYKVKITTVKCDLGLRNYESIFEACKNKNIGLFIGAAGFGTSGEFYKNSIHTESNMIEVNCTSIMELTHFFTQRFIKQKKGGIILFGSLVGFQGVPYTANYAATKAYVQSLAEGLYHELKPFDIDVLAVAPGPVKSGFGDRANMKMDMYLTPEQIGIPILKALGKKMTVLPGNLTKLLVYSLRTVPRTLKIRILKMIMGGMTKHQRV